MAEKETKQAEVEATEAKAVETTTEQQVTPEQFLKDFNWHNYEEGIDPIADSKLEEFEKLYSRN